MPIVHLRVDITPQEEQHLRLLATQAVDQAAEKWKTNVLAERGRAIEQIKRLYAVVMGFAVVRIISQIYDCVHALLTKNLLDWNLAAILLAQFVAFISLIALFFLGAERMLDRKYLRETCIDPPTRLGLWFDLLTLGITAVLFLILANVFPGQPIDAKDVPRYFGYFIVWLLIIYALDIIMLSAQLISLRQDPNQDRHLVHAYHVWIIINVVSLIAMLGIYFFVLGRFALLTIDVGAVAIILLHLARFFVDFFLTFEFYYPSERLTRLP